MLGIHIVGIIIPLACGLMALSVTIQHRRMYKEHEKEYKRKDRLHAYTTQVAFTLIMLASFSHAGISIYELFNR